MDQFRRTGDSFGSAFKSPKATDRRTDLPDEEAMRQSTRDFFKDAFGESGEKKKRNGHSVLSDKKLMAELDDEPQERFNVMRRGRGSSKKRKLLDVTVDREASI